LPSFHLLYSGLPIFQIKKEKEKKCSQILQYSVVVSPYLKNNMLICDTEQVGLVQLSKSPYKSVQKLCKT
jgi:hypothetical protein